MAPPPPRPLEEAHLGRAERGWAERVEVSDARLRPSVNPSVTEVGGFRPLVLRGG